MSEYRTIHKKYLFSNQDKVTLRDFPQLFCQCTFHSRVIKSFYNFCLGWPLKKPLGLSVYAARAELSTRTYRISHFQLSALVIRIPFTGAISIIIPIVIFFIAFISQRLTHLETKMMPKMKCNTAGKRKIIAIPTINSVI